MTEFPPLVDYQNHLSRAYILFHHLEVPSFARDYTIAYEPIPNVALDIILVGLQFIFSPDLSGQIFLVLCVTLFVLGTHLLGLSYNRAPHPLALVALFFSMSSTFLYGFANFCFGTGVFLCGFALWRMWRTQWSLVRLATVVIIALVAYLSHLAAYAFFGVAIGCIVLADLVGRRRGIRELFLDFAPLILPLLTFYLFMTGSGTVGEIGWGNISGKVVNLFNLVRSYNIYFDGVVAALFFLAAILYCWQAKLKEWNNEALSLSIIFFLLYLVCPKVLFTSWGADARFLLPAGVLFLLAFPSELSSARRRVALVVMILVFTGRLGLIASTWSMLDHRATRVMVGIDLITEGARVYPFFERVEGADRNKIDRALGFIGNQAIIRRHAYMPNVFSAPGAQPLRYAIPTPCSGECPMDISVDDLVAGDYQYLWAFGGALPKAARSTNGMLVRIWEREGFSLWSIQTN
jgi:hypothetical protein